MYLFIFNDDNKKCIHDVNLDLAKYDKSSAHLCKTFSFMAFNKFQLNRKQGLWKFLTESIDFIFTCGAFCHN